MQDQLSQQLFYRPSIVSNALDLLNSNCYRQPAGADFPNVVAKRHIFRGGGCRPRGAVTPKFELGRDFRTMHLPPSFIILYVYSFESDRVDKQKTNK